CGEQEVCQQQIHRHTGRQHNSTPPRRLRREAAWVGIALFVRDLAVLAWHSHIATQRQQADGVLRLATLDAGDTWGEADREFVHTNIGPFCSEEVTKLVDHDHQREDGNCGEVEQWIHAPTCSYMASTSVLRPGFDQAPTAKRRRGNASEDASCTGSV